MMKFNGTFDIDTLKVVFQVTKKLTFFLIVVYQYAYLKFRELKQPRGRPRQRQRQKPIGFMSKTTALLVHHAV